MSVFNIFRKPDINEGIAAFRKEKNAVLVDVRTQEEYNERHINGSINIPLQTIEKIRLQIKDLSTPLYVHCQSGARSARAVHLLRQMGYSSVADIGGISHYTKETTGG